MSDASAIEWTDTTWNPTTGCDRVSPGCDHCYALTLAKRLKGMGAAKYQRDGDPRTSGPGFGLTTHEDTLRIPLTWRKPRKVFVNSMSDLFHDKVDASFIARVFAVMAATPQHTYQVLTKRHGRMRSLLNNREFRHEIYENAWNYDRDGRLDPYRYAPEDMPPTHYARPDEYRDDDSDWWPLPNVWLGVSVEDQKRADLRIPALLKTPAAVRFLSCEPLLGPIDLCGPIIPGRGRPKLTYWLDGQPGWGPEQTDDRGRIFQQLAVGPRIDWVIVGGESGPGARPVDPEWVRQLRDHCTAAGVPYFFKQWGAFAPSGKVGLGRPLPGNVFVGEPVNEDGFRIEMTHVGKKAAGRVLDGRTWDEYPQAVALTSHQTGGES